MLAIPERLSVKSRDIAYHLHQQTNASTHETQGPSIIAQGDGCFVTTIDGERLLEGMAGLWCTSLGFSEQRLADAAYAQMRTLPYYQNFRGASNEPLIDLAETLVSRAPAGLVKAIFQSSGSEANETAIKLVWYYFNSIGQPTKKKIISRVSGYHGTGIATGSLTGLGVMHRSFDLPIDRFLKVSNPHFYRAGGPGESEEAFSTRCAQELEDLILREGPDTIAAFFAEPVMASAGVILPPAGYFEKIQAVLKRHDVLFVADEVVCGFGRTGSYWGCDTFGIVPDILTCAKALTSAYFPLSATLISERLYQGIKQGGDEIGVFAHGYTYGGHPVGAAVALETLRIYDETDIVSRVRTRAPQFQRRLAALGDHPLVGEARGVGLCGAIELVHHKESRTSFSTETNAAIRMVAFARSRGLIVRPIGPAVAFAPPLIITEAEVDMLFDCIEGALDELSRDLAGDK